MAELSPAAQAMLQAITEISPAPAGEIAAAILRAAVDQVVPHEATAPWDELKCDYDGDHWEMRQWVRHQFLAIANELEVGAMNTMADTDWITDRPPTEADADKYGFVTTPGPMGTVQNYWFTVMRGAPWRHTTLQGLIMAKSHKFTIIPRLFTSITYANNRYIALADDGTAWENWHGHAWRQIHPLPAREVME